MLYYNFTLILIFSKIITQLLYDFWFTYDNTFDRTISYNVFW